MLYISSYQQFRRRTSQRRCKSRTKSTAGSEYWGSGTSGASVVILEKVPFPWFLKWRSLVYWFLRIRTNSDTHSENSRTAIR